MKKFWSYISAFLLGVSLTAIIFAKWIAGDDYSVEIGRIKAKKNPGDLTVPINIDQGSEGRSRKPKGMSRKEWRKLKKN